MVKAITDSGFLRAVATAPRCTADQIATGDVVLLAPHPDDETLGCGQLIAALTSLGRNVQVVAVTDGAASHRNSRLFPASKLADLRANELHKSISILSGGTAPPPVHLNYPDLAAPDDPQSRESAARRISALITPRTSTLLFTWAEDPHPDHQRVARIAEFLRSQHPRLALWAYPVWGRFEAPAPEGRVVAFDDPKLYELKACAVAAHRSQMTDLISDDPEGFVMPPELQRHFIYAPEYYIHAG